MDYRLFQSLFHKKLQKGLLFFTAFFLFSISTLPAASRYIASLSLDFTRNENGTEMSHFLLFRFFSPKCFFYNADKRHQAGAVPFIETVRQRAIDIQYTNYTAVLMDRQNDL